MIDESLSYNEENEHWVAQYPYLYPREVLKGSKEVAIKSMLAKEKTLGKKGPWG